MSGVYSSASVDGRDAFQFDPCFFYCNILLFPGLDVIQEECNVLFILI
jgi:hypothetical protein